MVVRGALHIYRNTNTGKIKIKNEEEPIPSPLRSRGVFIVGFPPTRPSPLTSCKIVPYVLDSISTRPYYAGGLFVGFLTNQAKKVYIR